jgi:DNA-binding MarR family transcriptional regulator
LAKSTSGARDQQIKARAPVDPNEPVPRDYGLSHQIIWDLVSISNHLEEMRRCWAKFFGISGPQWLILMAINDLDQGDGVSVGQVSTKVHAVATFVTKQTKLLEKRGLLKRVSSTSDARVVLMSLSDEARKEISKLSERWEALHSFMFSDFDASTMRDVKYKLELLKKRSRIAVQRATEEVENG